MYVLARPRTTSTDAPRNLNPSMLVPSQQKDQKNQKKIQKNERKSLWTLAVTSQCRIIIITRANLKFHALNLHFTVMSQGHMSSAVHKVTAAALREYADRHSSPPGTDSKASQVSRTMPPAPFESPKNRRLQVPICSTHNFLADRRRAAWTGAKCCALQEMGRELGSLCGAAL